MDAINIKRVLEAFCADTGINQGRTGWVLSRCPMAPWKHDGGVDNKPSFGVKISDDGVSTCNCFSCGTKGSLYDILLEMKYHGAKSSDGFDFGLAMQLIAQEEENAELYIPDYETVGPTKTETKPFSEAWLSGFVTALKIPKAMNYLGSRGVYPELAKKLDLRFDSLRQRVCFPIRDWSKSLVGLHGRDITGHSPIPYHAYVYENHWNKLPWCGEHLCDPDETVVLCESVFDYAKVIQVYPNTLASLSAGLGYEKIKRVSGFPEIVTLYDYGTGGDSARGSISKYLNGVPITHVTPTEEQGDPGAMTLEEIRNALDGFGLSLTN